MSAESVKNIREILLSIEALKEQADQLHKMNENQDNASEYESLPASLVAEISAQKADVVLLDDVYRKGTSSQELKAESAATAVKKKVKTQSGPVSKSRPSDAEFDQMLSNLMKDMENQSKKTATSREPRLSAVGQTGVSDFNKLTNLKTDIDGLLSPYFNAPAASSVSQPTMPAPKSTHRQKAEKQKETDQRDSQKGLLNDQILLAMMTDDMRAEIADYIIVEIKQQISGWIAENLENILEDALRSVSTEARDALKARSVR